MKMHSIIAELCLAISALCLGAAYMPGRYWLIIPVLLVVILIRRITKKWPPFWISSGLLAVYIFLAAMGVAVNLPLQPILLGCVTALAGWELAGFERTMAGNSCPETGLPLEKHHLQSLAATSAAGLSLALISSYLDLDYPFGVTALLALMAMGGLTFGVQYLMEKKH